MDGSFLLPTLALVTLGIVIVLALVSKRRTDARHDDPNAPKSTLASDTPDTTRDRTEGAAPAGRVAPDSAHQATHFPQEPKPAPPKPAANGAEAQKPPRER